MRIVIAAQVKKRGHGERDLVGMREPQWREAIRVEKNE
jgi:hypothetical protein